MKKILLSTLLVLHCNGLGFDKQKKVFTGSIVLSEICIEMYLVDDFIGMYEMIFFEKKSKKVFMHKISKIYILENEIMMTIESKLECEERR